MYVRFGGCQNEGIKSAITVAGGCFQRIQIQFKVVV